MRDIIILAIKLWVHSNVCPDAMYYPHPEMVEGHLVFSGCSIPFTTEMPLRAVEDHHIAEVAKRNGEQNDSRHRSAQRR